MISEKRHAANRDNARRSTGPSTPGGLATATANTISHGLAASRPIVPGESGEEWQSHLDGVIAHWQPDGAMEAALASRLALLLWRLRRVVNYETAITSVGLEEAAILPKYDADDAAEDSRNGRSVINEASRVYRAELNVEKIRERQPWDDCRELRPSTARRSV